MLNLDPSFIPFHNAWERIERAKTHRYAVREAWESLSHEDLAEFSLYVNDDGTGSMHSYPVAGGLPVEFSLLIGELLYQLRAALDNVIYDAAVLAHGKNPPPNSQNLEFPICSKPARFQELSYKIAPLSEQRKAVIEAVQPYNAPNVSDDLLVYNYNRSLGILNDWARWDRHRKLNILRSWAVKASPKLRLPPGVTMKSMKVHAWGFLEHKNEIATFRLRGFQRGMKVEGNPDLTFDIAVDEAPSPCHETDTLGTRLTAMIRTVSFITDHIQRNIRPEEL